MKRFLPLLVTSFIALQAHAQITITAADMPVSGDMLVYSNVTATGLNINPGDSGVGMVWNYDLTSASQGVDTFKSPYEVNHTFGGTISFTAAGYKVADSIPGLSTILNATGASPVPVNITNIYTYFQEITTPRSAYIACAYSYNLESIVTLPTAANYTDPDVWYFFPLTYGNATDSTNYKLHLSLMSFIGIDEVGYRKTRVDGWGTITTPYYTTPQNCIRVRSEIHEIDSVHFSGTDFGFPRNTVEYKWLINGSHYPALWVTSNVIAGIETITQVRYRDALQPSKVVNEKAEILNISAYPNPAVNGTVTLSLPADWSTFRVEVFDAQAKVVSVVNDQRTLDIAALPSGQYFIRITSGLKTGYATVIK